MRIAIPMAAEATIADDSATVYNWFFAGVQTGHPARANDGTALLELVPPPSLDKLVAMSTLVHRWKWGRPMPVYRLGQRGWVRWHASAMCGTPRRSSTPDNRTETST